MEFIVKEVEKTSYQGSDKEEKFVTLLKQSNGDIVLKAAEKLQSSFRVDDVYELKKLESQTSVGEHAPRKGKK